MKVYPPHILRKLNSSLSEELQDEEGNSRSLTELGGQEILG